MPKLVEDAKIEITSLDQMKAFLDEEERMLEEIRPGDLGNAGLVEERKIGDKEMIFVENCQNPKSVSILLRGGTEHVVDELEREMNDALRVTACAMEDGKYVTGGGATEIELALKLRDYTSSVGGREQLAIQAFADAVDVVPRALAASAEQAPAGVGGGMPPGGGYPGMGREY